MIKSYTKIKKLSVALPKKKLRVKEYMNKDLGNGTILLLGGAVDIQLEVKH